MLSRVIFSTCYAAAGNRADAADFIDLTNLKFAKLHIAELRRQHALHSVGDIVDGIVNNAIHTQFHMGCGGFFLGDRIRAHIETR